MPPLPQPRQICLRPLQSMAPVYNNLGQAVNTNTSNNGTFDFERGLMLGQITHFRLKPKIKLGSA